MTNVTKTKRKPKDPEVVRRKEINHALNWWKQRVEDIKTRGPYEYIGKLKDMEDGNGQG